MPILQFFWRPAWLRDNLMASLSDCQSKCQQFETPPGKKFVLQLHMCHLVDVPCLWEDQVARGEDWSPISYVKGKKNEVANASYPWMPLGLTTTRYNYIWYCPLSKVQKCTHHQTAEHHRYWRTCSRSPHGDRLSRGSNFYSLCRNRAATESKGSVFLVDLEFELHCYIGCYYFAFGFL